LIPNCSPDDHDHDRALNLLPTAPKKKGQKLNLVDFFAETPGGGSWADEMDVLPTARA
jgi:hypothetical protein